MLSIAKVAAVAAVCIADASDPQQQLKAKKHLRAPVDTEEQAETLALEDQHEEHEQKKQHKHDKHDKHALVKHDKHAKDAKKEKLSKKQQRKVNHKEHKLARKAAQKERKEQALFQMHVHDATDAVNSGADSEEASSSTLILGAYAAAIFVMIAVVTAMFYPMGAFVCAQVVTYVSCLAFIKIALKMVYEQGFDYPKFITATHLLLSSAAAFVVLAHRKLTTGAPVPVPTSSEFFMGILPIASTFGFSIACENSALVFVSAAFSEVIASCNPVMSAFLTWALGMPFALQLIMPIAVVVLGCLVSVTGELSFSGIGLALLLLSVFFRGFKSVMQQKLMTGETKDKFDPVTLMAWTCMSAFLVVFGYSLATEGVAPFNDYAAAKDPVALTAALLGSAVIACTLNISALFVIKKLGAVGMQMVSQMKSILVVIGGIALLGETFTNMQKVGFVTVLAGVYWYSYMQRTASAATSESNEKGK